MNPNRNQKSKSRDLAELVLGMAFMWCTFLILAYHLYGDDTPRAQLPLMSFNEGQPHLTFNELAWFVDAMTFPALKAYPANASPDLNVPVAEGDLFIVPSGASGSWYGYDNDITQYRNATWDFISPATGWIVNKPDFSSLRFNGSAWTEWQGSVSANTIESTTNVSEISIATVIQSVTNSTSLLRILDTTMAAEYGPMEIFYGLQENGTWSAEMTIWRNQVQGQGPKASRELEIKLYNRDAVEQTRISSYRASMFTKDVLLKNGLIFNATDTPADPSAGNAVLWLDTAGNLRIKSNVSDTIHEGTPFEY